MAFYLCQDDDRRMTVSDHPFGQTDEIEGNTWQEARDKVNEQEFEHRQGYGYYAV